MNYRAFCAAIVLALLPLCAVNAQGIPNGWGNGVPNAAAGVQANLTASSAPTVNNDQTQGYQVGSLWQNASTGQVWIARSVATGAAVWIALGVTDFPGYIAGNWYIPVDPANMPGSSAVPGAGSIRLYPAFIKQRMTIENLGVRVTTLSASGNVQAAIYANNYSTMRPTGNPLVSTASMSTSATGNVNASASLQLDPGFYWFATNCDNGTAIFTGISAGSTLFGFLLGSSSQSNNLGNGSTTVGLSVAQTFGTWPSLTSASFSDVTSSGTVPIVQFQVLSIP